jgi:hypothetical protein
LRLIVVIDHFVDKVDNFVFISVDQGLEVPGVTFPHRAHYIIIGKYLVFFYHYTIITDFTLKSCEKIMGYWIMVREHWAKPPFPSFLPIST